MRQTNFEKLQVYRQAEDLADLVWDMVKNWRSSGRYDLGRQLVRSADSVGANIAEGAGRGTAQDNRRFVRIARGSLYETRHWIRRAYKRGLFARTTFPDCGRAWTVSPQGSTPT